jgi:chloramphenicol 3-O phosphotransferase
VARSRSSPATTVGTVNIQVIVLNGGSSSGKTTLARRLQDRLGASWLTLGVDDLIRALPGGDQPFGSTDKSIGVLPDGTVTVSDGFRQAERAWYRGLAAIARNGSALIIDEVFLGGRASQERLEAALAGLSVLWVGVRCDADVAEARERERHDRTIGMARLQAEKVHEGVEYDLVVDTTGATVDDCARTVIDQLKG